MHESRIQAVDHVHLEVPPGIEQELRWFYGELAELDEVPCPSDAGWQLCFKSHRIELRLLTREEPRRHSAATRVTIAVSSLDDTMAILDDRRDRYDRATGLFATDRCIRLLDPAGHLVELRQHFPLATI